MATTMAYGNTDISPTTWASETAYSVDDYVVPTTPNDRIYECIVEGTSGETEPTWSTGIGSTTRDGTVVWFCTNTFSTNPLTVILDTEGIGGAPTKSIWVKIPEVVEDTDFVVYGSYTGFDGTWKRIDDITVPQGNRDDNYKDLHTAYRFIKVVAEESVTAEIEIVAGE